jgi:hypothetical protein
VWRFLARRLTLEAATRADYCLWATSVVFLLGRFVGLEHSPPGFFSDEFRGALHQVCISQVGQSANGTPWPAFVVGGGGGLYTPPFLYLGALWTKLWGPSIATSRAFVALFGAATVIGITALARRIGGVGLARYVFLAAALSPWGFQFSRIAWDPPLACAGLVLSIYFWTHRERPLALIASATCLAGALYCYPPTRLQAPLVFLALGLWALFRRTLSVKQIALFSVVLIALCGKLIQGTLDGSLNARGSVEAIWAADFVKQNHGRYSKAWFLAQSLLDNLHAHFRPSYLFLTGDTNLRHSSQWLGELGYVDIFALVLIAYKAGTVLYGALFERRPTDGSPESVRDEASERRVHRAVVFSAGAYLAGVLPAALCWSGVPHSLRSIGCWPFLAFFSGFVLYRAARARPEVAWLSLGVSLVYAGVFGHAYFVKYPALSGFWYDEHVKRAMLDPSVARHEREQLTRNYPEAFRYYAIVSRGETCQSSQEALEDALGAPRSRRRK